MRGETIKFDHLTFLPRANRILVVVAI